MDLDLNPGLLHFTNIDQTQKTKKDVYLGFV